MRSRVWLVVLWISGILFPMVLLAGIWPSFGRLFNALFAPTWVHVVMHAFLYAVLAVIFCQWFPPNSIRSVLTVLGLALLVGILQETLQLAVQGIWPGWKAELFDLLVDAGGAAMGMLGSHFAPRVKAMLRDRRTRSSL
jgi:VanZ family protein